MTYKNLDHQYWRPSVAAETTTFHHFSMLSPSLLRIAKCFIHIPRLPTIWSPRFPCGTLHPVKATCSIYTRPSVLCIAIFDISGSPLLYITLMLLRPSQSFTRELLEPIHSPLTRTLRDLPRPLKPRLLGEYCVHLGPPPRFAALIVLQGLEEQVGKPLVPGVRSTRPTWILDNLPEYATSTERSIPTERDIAAATAISRH